MGIFDPDSIQTRLDMLNRSTDEEIADARLEQILEAIQNQDKEALRMAFSEKSVKEADDFDGNADRLFEFVQGEIDSWKKSSGPNVHDINDRYTIKQINSYYFVNTDKEEYFFLLRDFPIDTGNLDNVGLYLLLVVRAEDRLSIYDKDKKIIYDGDTKIEHIGIYLPFE